MPIRSLAVPNGSTSASARKLPEYTRLIANASPASSVVAARRTARNGLCSWPVAPRRLPDRLPARDEDPVMDVALARPGAAQRDELPVGVREVEDGRHRAADRERRPAAVGERQRAGDDRAVREQRGADGHEQAGRRVDEVDLQRLRLVAGLRVRRRQVRQRRLAGHDAVRGVAQVEDRRTVRALDDQRGDAEVPDARHRDLERHRLADAIGEAVEGHRAQVAPRGPGSQRGAGVEVPEPAVLEHPHRPARAAVLQVPLAGGCVPVDRHPPAASVRRVHAQR